MKTNVCAPTGERTFGICIMWWLQCYHTYFALSGLRADTCATDWQRQGNGGRCQSKPISDHVRAMNRARYG